MSSCRDESQQGVITVINYDNSLFQTSIFSARYSHVLKVTIMDRNIINIAN